MTDKPRLQLLNVKVLTRLQRWIVGVATLVGVFGVVLCLAGRFPLGILRLGLSAMTNWLTNLSGTGQVEAHKTQHHGETGHQPLLGRHPRGPSRPPLPTAPRRDTRRPSI
jgi:hypothetical protein